MSESQTIQGSRGCIVLFGILSIVAGVAAIGSPFLSGALVTTIIGICLIFGGVMELLATFGGFPGTSGRIWPFLGGLLAIVAGGLVIAHPVIGAAVIGMILIVFFLLDGITRSLAAFQLRPMTGWGWQLFSGLASIVLAVLLWLDWPLSGLWAIGVLIGIRILFAGFGILSLAGAVAALDVPGAEKE